MVELVVPVVPGIVMVGSVLAVEDVVGLALVAPVVPASGLRHPVKILSVSKNTIARMPNCFIVVPPQIWFCSSVPRKCGITQGKQFRTKRNQKYS